MEALLEKEKIETPVEEIPQKKKKSAYWKTTAVIFSSCSNGNTLMIGKPLA